MQYSKSLLHGHRNTWGQDFTTIAIHGVRTSLLWKYMGSGLHDHYNTWGQDFMTIKIPVVRISWPLQYRKSGLHDHRNKCWTLFILFQHFGSQTHSALDSALSWWCYVCVNDVAINCMCYLFKPTYVIYYHVQVVDFFNEAINIYIIKKWTWLFFNLMTTLWIYHYTSV